MHSQLDAVATEVLREVGRADVLELHKTKKRRQSHARLEICRPGCKRIVLDALYDEGGATIDNVDDTGRAIKSEWHSVFDERPTDEEAQRWFRFLGWGFGRVSAPGRGASVLHDVHPEWGVPSRLGEGHSAFARLAPHISDADRSKARCEPCQHLLCRSCREYYVASFAESSAGAISPTTNALEVGEAMIEASQCADSLPASMLLDSVRASPSLAQRWRGKRAGCWASTLRSRASFVPCATTRRPSYAATVTSGDLFGFRRELSMVAYPVGVCLQSQRIR